MVKLFEAKFAVDVVCEHPDDSSMYHHFYVDWDDADAVSDEELRKLIEQKVNPNGYWHEVKIKAYTIDGGLKLSWDI